MSDIVIDGHRIAVLFSESEIAARIAEIAREIAARQQIPEPFLEQLLASLRRAEVVRSIRGAGGGYVLADTAVAGKSSG